jgi:hypothetical protein
MRKILEIGGLVAGVLLIAFGIATVALALQGRSTVHHELSLQQINGSADMTPAGIKVEADKAGLTGIDLPTCSVADQPVTSGTAARCFASYMNIHALEASGGLPYSQMPRYATADGKGTNDATAATQVNGRPADNAARNLWVTETALATALNMSYMAEQLALFSLVVGIALLLAGIGFIVLSLGGALRRSSTSTAAAPRPLAKPVPAA